MEFKTVSKGVYEYTHRNLFRAKINYKNKPFHLGYFENKEDAITAYNTAKENAKKGIPPERAVIRTNENGKRIYRTKKSKEKATASSASPASIAASSETSAP